MTNDKIGVKHDKEKTRFSLLPSGTIVEVIKVLMVGAKKYDDDNWKYVDNARERYYNAACRHLNAWWEGEKVDPETNENHLSHCICNLLFLLWFELNEGKEIKK